MSKKEYDVIVYVCRAQPFHNGHFMMIHKALSMADEVFILLGSANQSRTATKDPFTSAERAMMIMKSFTETENKHLHFLHIQSYLYDDQKWITEVNRKVQMYLDNLKYYETGKLGLIGHFRDDSSKYLDWFPEWELIEEAEVPVGLSATNLREVLFREQTQGSKFGDRLTTIAPSVPVGTQEFLKDFIKTKEYKNLWEEYKFIQEYKENWKKAPYPVIFSTTDVVVVVTGYVLLVTRKATPGKGLLALPGGFVGYNETLEYSAIRELREETGIKIPYAVLKGSIKGFHVFDAPDRSQRGRTITNTFYIELDPEVVHDKGRDGLPKVKGSDDAAKAGWFRLDMLDELRPQIFEDHYDQIQYFVGSHKA